MSVGTTYRDKTCRQVYQCHQGHDLDGSIVVEIFISQLKQLLIGVKHVLIQINHSVVDVEHLAGHPEAQANLNLDVVRYAAYGQE